MPLERSLSPELRSAFRANGRYSDNSLASTPSKRPSDATRANARSTAVDGPLYSPSNPFRERKAQASSVSDDEATSLGLLSDGELRALRDEGEDFESNRTSGGTGRQSFDHHSEEDRAIKAPVARKKETPRQSSKERKRASPKKNGRSSTK